MLQFYFLSVLLNIVSGLIFLYPSRNPEDALSSGNAGDDLFSDLPDSDDENPASGFSKAGKPGMLEIPFLEEPSFRLVVGILMVLTGLMKLLSPIQYDVPVVGDLVPSLAGLAGGFSILLEWYKNKSAVAVNLPEIVDGIFVEGRKYLGIFCIAAGVLHFIFPRVLFL